MVGGFGGGDHVCSPPSPTRTHTLTCYVCLHSKFLVNSLDSHHRTLGIVPCAVQFAYFRAGLPRPSPLLDCFANQKRPRVEAGVGGEHEVVELMDSEDEK